MLVLKDYSTRQGRGERVTQPFWYFDGYTQLAESAPFSLVWLWWIGRAERIVPEPTEQSRKAAPIGVL